MILSGSEIRKALDSGVWEISDGERVLLGDEYYVGPNSVDVRLGDRAFLGNPYSKNPAHIPFDFTKSWLSPGNFVLGHTIEAIDCSAPLTIDGEQHYFVPMLEGRSTLARMGVCIHQTAGFGDYGFDRQWTLEITTHLPVMLTPGMRIGQIYFQKLLGESVRYNGAYKDQSGPTMPAARP